MFVLWLAAYFGETFASISEGGGPRSGGRTLGQGRLYSVLSPMRHIVQCIRLILPEFLLFPLENDLISAGKYGTIVSLDVR